MAVVYKNTPILKIVLRDPVYRAKVVAIEKFVIDSHTLKPQSLGHWWRNYCQAISPCLMVYYSRPYLTILYYSCIPCYTVGWCSMLTRTKPHRFVTVWVVTSNITCRSICKQTNKFDQLCTKNTKASICCQRYRKHPVGV
ncbi:hypothetical protein DFA_02812 [Cavenderia fasciculata]|uniref:Uncharacterized protein n=1 Tax=Cavenderia fasciculata TaxID=261658 RepID=F4PID5_CACFS|nr:uncharacterized protein DFA_02812 [Cavenderia fasciculata]EGG24569.1 hypothetical protein DFA_02812 [Cavenderia fasciculata]|eukprot:XP_004362420.1 hypothetical protein DFA_02812 [Cavenderia fasciculata]